MFMVTGGWSGSVTVDSTEIFDPNHGSWRTGAALPSPRDVLRGANIANRVLIFGIDINCEHKVLLLIIIDILAGGFDGSALDSILEYDFTGDSYKQIGTMTQAREWHAVTVVQYRDFSEWCE